MISFDTNLPVYAMNSASEFHKPALEFMSSLSKRRDVVVCELVLVELYLKLRNERIFPRPLSASQATTVCQSYRQNRLWKIVEAAPVMENVWKSTGEEGFAFRRIIDLRLGQTLLYAGVTHFATSNVKDFKQLGFEKVWNPCTELTKLSE